MIIKYEMLQKKNKNDITVKNNRVSYQERVVKELNQR